MEKVLYHASRESYKPGQVVTVEGRNRFTSTIEAEGRGWVEDLLEAGRPAHCVRRTEALFAFAELGSCLRFAEGEDNQRGVRGEWRFYQVQMEDPTRHPMCLTDRIDRRGKDADNKTLVEEYWAPKQDWKRFEYIARDMLILAEVPRATPEQRQADLLRAMSDREIAVAL